MCGLVFSNGTVTSSAVEQDLFSPTSSDAYYGAYIFCHNMQVGDTVVIKIYVKDQEGGTNRIFQTVTLSNVQSDPAYFVPFLPTKAYKITIQRTAGTDRVYNWMRVDVT